MVIPNIRAQIVGDCFVVSLLAMTVLFLVPKMNLETTLLDKWLQGFSFRIDLNLHLWWFVLAGALAMIVALLTVSYQAIRASFANPIESLRYE